MSGQLTPEQLEQIDQLVAAAPPLSQHQADQIRMIFRRQAPSSYEAAPARAVAPGEAA